MSKKNRKLPLPLESGIQPRRALNTHGRNQRPVEPLRQFRGYPLLVLFPYLYRVGMLNTRFGAQSSSQAARISSHFVPRGVLTLRKQSTSHFFHSFFSHHPGNQGVSEQSRLVSREERSTAPYLLSTLYNLEKHHRELPISIRSRPQKTGEIYSVSTKVYSFK